MSKHSKKNNEIIKKNKSESRKILFATAAQIAAIFEVSERTVRDWASRRGMPKTAHGQYPVREALLWWLDNVYDASGEDSIEELRDSKIRYWEAKADREEIKRDQEKEQLIPLAEIGPQWAGRMREISAGLEAFGSRIAPRVVGKGIHEIQRICDDEQWRLRDSFCRTGRFCHPESSQFFDRLRLAWDKLKKEMANSAAETAERSKQC